MYRSATSGPTPGTLCRRSGQLVVRGLVPKSLGHCRNRDVETLDRREYRFQYRGTLAEALAHPVHQRL
jgi:hypothetical protein